MNRSGSRDRAERNGRVACFGRVQDCRIAPRLCICRPIARSKSISDFVCRQRIRL